MTTINSLSRGDLGRLLDRLHALFEMVDDYSARRRVHRLYTRVALRYVVNI